MTQEELNKILEAHNHFLTQDCEGWEDMKADLRGADLSHVNLREANLRGADLSNANLRNANLRETNLCYADLRGADLSYANLRGTLLSNAKLCRADFSGVDLSGADLSFADLSFANLSFADLNNAILSNVWLYNAILRSSNLAYANLREADLRGANLSDAYLNRSNLSNANLISANLCRADLSEADTTDVKYNESTAFFALVCPKEGDFIAWKKIIDYDNDEEMIVKLRVPSEAKRSSATTRKCRCEYAEVLELQNLDGTPYKDDKVVNDNYVETIYKVGEIVRPDSWDDNRWNECSNGIHFFMTRDEAVRY